MILEEYSAELAKRMDRLIVPEIFTPYHVRVLWARIYNSEDLCFEISPDVHRHFFYEIHCVLDGQLTYECEGQSYVLTPNTGILLSPNTSHICHASSCIGRTFSQIFLRFYY